MNTALGFCGKIGSGKSTISKAVAKAMHWPFVSFGDHVRRVAIERGLTPLRANLQDVGLDLIGQGWEQFCLAVLRQAKWSPGEPIVIDGIRHEMAFRTLSELVRPATLKLVLVVTSEDERQRRIPSLQTPDNRSPGTADSHATEAEVGSTLISLANLKVDGADDVTKTAETIVRWVRSEDAAPSPSQRVGG